MARWSPRWSRSFPRRTRVASTGPRRRAGARGHGTGPFVTVGIGTEVCGVAPALHAQRDGYQVAFVADACGSATALGRDISLRRMEQEGVTLTTTASVSAELTGEYPKHAQIMFG
jgi:nicotinamidase-related amidase